VEGPRVVELRGGGPRLVVDVHDAAAAAGAPDARGAPDALRGDAVSDGTTRGAARGAVLCVHGFASGRRSSKIGRLAARLPALGWTVLALDLQGHGDSGGDFAGLTVARSIDDVRRVAALPEFAAAPRRVLVGSSFGGLVAAWAAAEDAVPCDGLVLIAPAFGYLDRYLPGLPPAERNAWESGRPHVIRMEHRDVLLGSGVLAERFARGTERLAAAWRTPAVIVHGTADDEVPSDASRDLAGRAARDDLELVLLDGADHRLTGRLDELVDVAERFLRTISAAPQQPRI
jgi:hypothetical protein